MLLSLPPELSISATAPSQAIRLPILPAHPAYDMETQSICDAADAYVKNGSSAKLRPDRTMRSVAQFLATPKSAHAGAEQTEGLKEFTYCPIMHVTFDNPVVASDGFTYSLSDIKQWWQTQAKAKQPLTSPMTREAITDFRLIPSTAMRAMMADLGITDCHSPNPAYDEAVQWAQARPSELAAAPVRRHLQLDYLRDAPAVLAQSDHRIDGLNRVLSRSGQPLNRVQIVIQGMRAQAQIKTLFAAPQFDHIHEVAKTFRAVDVQLQLGHVKKTEALLRQGLSKAPDNQILLSRLALVEARAGRTEEAQQTLAKLFACPADEAFALLGEHTLYNPARQPHPSTWPLLAAHGFMLLDTLEAQDGRALLHAAATLFPSRLLNSYRAEA